MSSSLWERGFPETPMARVLVVVARVEAIRQLAGSLGYLASRKHPVVVGVQHDPPGAPGLGRFDGGYAGLSVLRLPTPDENGWETGAAALLERHAPHLVVVTALEGEDAPHRDYVRAARRLGIPSVYVALHADDVASSGFAADLPDCMVVWNRPQRREAMDLGLPVRRTSMLGAHLWTDVLESREPADRHAWCRTLGIEPSRRVVLVAPPAGPVPAIRDWLTAWDHARAAAPDATVRNAAVVLFTRGAGDDGVRAASGLDVVAGIAAGTGLVEQHEAARPLLEVMTHADAVVTADAAIALEGLSRARPVIAVHGGDAGPHGDELARLAAALHAHGEWPWTAASAAESVGRLARAFDGMPRDASLAAARGLVRPHGDEMEPGQLLVTRVMRQVVPHPAPLAARHPAAAHALPARRLRARGAPALLMVALPANALDQWRGLLEALIEKGHRVALVTGPETGGGAIEDRLAGLHGVFAAGRLPTPSAGSLERGVVAIALRMPELEGNESPTAVRWRRRVDGVELPAWLDGVDGVTGRPVWLDRVRRLAERLDRSLAPSVPAARLVDRAQPDAVLMLPALDTTSAVESWTAHLDLARAARAYGVPAAVSRMSGVPVEDLLAQAAIRPSGVSSAHAAAIVDTLQRWLDAPDSVPQRSSPQTIATVWAAAALGGITGAARGRRALEGAIQPARRALSRMWTAR